MLSKKSLIRPIISAVAVTGCMITGFSVKSWAQSNSGFTLWSGVARENQLNYYLDYGGQPNGWDRYRFKIPGKKLELGVAQIAISYPDYFCRSCYGLYDHRVFRQKLGTEQPGLYPVERCWSRKSAELLLRLRWSTEWVGSVSL